MQVSFFEHTKNTLHYARDKNEGSWNNVIWEMECSCFQFSKWVSQLKFITPLHYNNLQVFHGWNFTMKFTINICNYVDTA